MYINNKEWGINVIHIFFIYFLPGRKAQVISAVPSSFPVTAARIYVDEKDFPLVIKSAELLQQDIETVTGKKIPIIHSLDKPYKNIIAVSSERSSLLQELQLVKKIWFYFTVKGKWECFQVKNIPAL